MLLTKDIDWLKNEVEKIPGDAGWWHADDGESFLKLAFEMVGDLGLDRYKAIEILATAYWATANEFGL